MSKSADALNTALRLFNEHGYHAVGVDRIRDEAHVSKMTLYKHFPNKNMLIKAVLQKRHEDFMASLKDYVDARTGPTEKIKGLFDWHVRWFVSEAFHGCMFIKAAGEFHQDPDLTAVSRGHKQGIYEYICDLLGDLDIPGTKEEAANFIQVVLDGMIVSASIFHSQEKIDSAWHSVSTYLGIPYTPLEGAPGT